MSRGRAVLKLTLSCQLLTFYLILSVLPLHSQDIPFQKENPKDTAKEITAAVNGAPITSNLLEIRTKQLSSVSSFHGRISDKELEEIKNKALDELITEELVYQESKRMGIAIPENEIDKRLKEIKRRTHLKMPLIRRYQQIALTRTVIRS